MDEFYVVQTGRSRFYVRRRTPGSELSLAVAGPVATAEQAWGRLEELWFGQLAAVGCAAG